ncbi:MAG: gluconate 2-dehydrogenase subunit 3 family protein [Burkholderiales bacterium]|nr:gluconate 2-dehydrogenase subunit 3 family protein [Burkholderiales bacterium]
MQPSSRRLFLKSAGATALATTASLPAAAEAAAAAHPTHGPQTAHAAAHGAPAATDPQAVYVFFNPQEARFIEAATARLIPSDEVGPGAIEAQVPRYLDRQLAGAWGAGERLYRSGPWQAGTPSQGYQLPYTPAELFRTALRGIAADLQRAGRPAFEHLPPLEQDRYLTELQEGRRELEGVPEAVFFETLWAMTVEGYFADPAYGGNTDMASWRMIGFPGAYANYYAWVDRHGMKVDLPPTSLAQHGRTIAIHPMPMGQPMPGAVGGMDHAMPAAAGTHPHGTGGAR